MTSALRWIGTNARWVLAVGVIAAIFLPGVSTILRPFLPVLVVLIFAVAIARTDLGPALRRAASPRGALRLTLWVTGLLVVTPTLLFGATRAAGFDEATISAVVYTTAAPPIMSSAAMCLMLGLNAVFALEITVTASALAPLLGPMMVKLLLGDALPIDPLTLGVRIGAMIAMGMVLGIAMRKVIGAARIAREARLFDGIAALATLVFVVPLFDGVGEMLRADSLGALGILGLVTALNFGLQAATVLAVHRGLGPAEAGAAGFVWGNRTVAIYLAALPPDPAFSLFVALYQVPMLFTPLLMRRVLAR